MAVLASPLALGFPNAVPGGRKKKVFLHPQQLADPPSRRGQGFQTKKTDVTAGLCPLMLVNATWNV